MTHRQAVLERTLNRSQTVLVIGAGGSFGSAVTQELLARGFVVRALCRPGTGKKRPAGLVVVEGDVQNPDDVRRGARGVQVIVHAYNVPYAQWATRLIPAAQNVADAAAAERALIVFPGNVYGLGRDFSAKLREDATREAPTAKGQLRNEVEALLDDATHRGAQLLIVRAGDYFGPLAGETSWFEHMTKNALKGGALVDPVGAQVPHEWAYLPDLARATVQLIARRAELAPSDTFHFSSFQVPSLEMVAAVQAELGPLKVRGMPWTLMTLLSPFSSFLREVLEMKYLMFEPVLLDDAKLRATLPDLKQTPLQQAVRETLAEKAPALRGTTHGRPSATALQATEPV